MADIKNYLYTWCCKRGNVLSYEYSNVGLKSPHFICQATISTIDYVAQGGASSKKEAQTLAAKNFVKYLMDHNFMPKINESPHPSNPTTIKQPNNIANGRTENTADQDITKQKLNEFDAIDQSASLHGNWRLENAKSRLHHFLQINRLSSEYRYKVIGTTPQTKAYIAEMSFHVNKDDNPIMINASEYGKTKIAASKACALMLLRQLFHMGLVESYDPTARSSKNKKIGKKRGKDGGFRDTPKRIKPETVSNWIMDPPCNVNLNPEINVKFDEALKMLQLIPLDIIPEEPSLNVKNYTQILEKVDFSVPSDTNSIKPAALLWTPPMKDWNTWACKEILPPINLEEYNDMLLKEWNLKIDENCPEHIKILEERKNMPIYAHKDEILDAILNHAVVFVKGPPKIGKSTQIPQYILEQGIIQGRGSQNCVCIVSGQSVPPLLARDLTAKILADRVQSEHQNSQKTAVIAGFQNFWGETDIVAPNEVADNTVLSPDQGILPRPFGSALYCNMEYFLQRIMRYGLKGISHLIIDEVYERDSLTEFILMLLRDCVQAYNPHFKLIILSSDPCISDIENYFVNQDRKIIDIFSKKDHSIISNVSIDGTSAIDEVNNEKTETIDFKKTEETLFLEDCIELTHFDYNGIVGTAYGRMRRRKKAKLRRNLPPSLHNLNYTVDPNETKAPFCDFTIVDGELELENQKRGPLKIYKPLTRYVCSQMSLKNDISFELIYSIIDYIVSSKEYGTILIFLPNVTYIQSLEKYLLDIIGRMSIEENSSNNIIESENDGNIEESKITEESINNENANSNRKKRNFTFYKLHEWTSFAEWEKMSSTNQNDDTTDKSQKIILTTSIGERLTLRDDNPLYIINTCKVEKGGIYVTKSDNTTIKNQKLIVITSKSNVDFRSTLLNSSSKGGGSCFNLISRECYERLPIYTIYPSNLPRILLIALILAQTQNAKIELQYQKLLRPDLYQRKTSLSFLLQMGAFELIGLNNLNVSTTSVDQLFANNIKVSALGRILAYLPDMGDLKMGKMIIAASILGVSDLMTTLVSLHVNPDIFDNAMLSRKTLLRHLKTICDTNNRNSDLLAKLLIYNNQYILSRKNLNKEINVENNADSPKQPEENFWNENFCQNVHRTQIYLSFNLNSLLNLNEPTIQQSLRPNQNKLTLQQMDHLVALLNIGFNPNICYLLGPRFVLLDKSILGIIDKHSIISTFKRSPDPNFPFFIFTEKVLSKNRYINDLSLVSPLQFLLFGTYQFCLQADTSIITINDWIRIKMDSHLLAKLILLRGAFDKMINVLCQDSTLLHKLLQHSETHEHIQNHQGMEPRIAKSCIIRDVIFALTNLNAGAFNNSNKPLETEPSVLQDLTVQQSTPENSINNEKTLNKENNMDDVLSITSFDSEDSLYIPYQHLLKESTMMINMYRRPPPPAYFYYHPNYYNPNLRYFAKNAPNNMRFYGPRILPHFYRGPRPSFYPPPPHTEELEKAEIENEIPPSPINLPADMKTFPRTAGFSGPTVPPLRRPPFSGPPRRPVFYGRPRQQPVFNNRYGGPRGGPYPFYGPNGNYRFLGPRGPRMLPYQTNDNNSKTENTNITNINNGIDESNNISGSADVSMDDGKNHFENNEELSLTNELDRSGMSFLDITEGNGFENSSLME